MDRHTALSPFSGLLVWAFAGWNCVACQMCRFRAAGCGAEVSRSQPGHRHARKSRPARHGRPMHPVESSNTFGLPYYDKMVVVEGPRDRAAVLKAVRAKASRGGGWGSGEIGVCAACQGALRIEVLPSQRHGSSRPASPHPSAHRCLCCTPLPERWPHGRRRRGRRCKPQRARLPAWRCSWIPMWRGARPGMPWTAPWQTAGTPSSPRGTAQQPPPAGEPTLVLLKRGG